MTETCACSPGMKYHANNCPINPGGLMGQPVQAYSPSPLHLKNERHLKILGWVVFIYSSILVIAGFVFGGVFGFVWLLIVIAFAKGTMDRAERRALVREQRESLSDNNFNVRIHRG